MEEEIKNQTEKTLNLESSPPSTSNSIGSKEMLQLHWANYQMRQAHIWQSLNRLTLSIVTLWAIPFVKPELFKTLSLLVFFFPMVAILLAWIVYELSTKD